MPGSHLDVGLSTWVIITVLLDGIAVTHLSTKFLKYLSENTSSALHFIHEVFCETDYLRVAPRNVLGWLIPACENQSCIFSGVMSAAISDLSHSGNIYTPETGKRYKLRNFFSQRAIFQTYTSTPLDIFLMSLTFFCTLTFFFTYIYSLKEETISLLQIERQYGLA